MNSKSKNLKEIPKIDEILQADSLAEFFYDTPRIIIVDSVREVIDEYRQEILNGSDDNPKTCTFDQLVNRAINAIREKNNKRLIKVINATGVVLHTNLGRARLSKKMCDSVVETAMNYTTLEYDIIRGERGSRHEYVEKLVCLITGTEAAMVVNNNAAATMLCLSAIGANKEVIVSRGELVEIGGSFRVPDVMAQSGCVLKEVGTTNKTNINDYNSAINDNTAALMKVHASNYKIVGFTKDVSLEELVELGKETQLPVIYDMGSGLMIDLSEYGIDEPSVKKSVSTGIDVILFSGDKLLGGPQGGIIAGKKKYIDAMKKHPLARVVRIDKMSIAAMESAFREYLDENNAKVTIPVLNMLTKSREELVETANNMVLELKSHLQHLNVSSVNTKNRVGGGSAPETILYGAAVEISTSNVKIEKIERRLRRAEIPIIGRINKDKLYLDVRTVTEKEMRIIIDTLIEIDKEFSGDIYE